MRTGIKAIRGMAVSNLGSLAVSITRPPVDCTPEVVAAGCARTLWTTLKGKCI
jgi:hypothetical protein